MALKLGYQVYSAREEAEKDLAGVLQKIAEIGYDGVEFAGFYGRPADEVAKLLEKTKLAAPSSHVPFAAIIEDMKGVIAYHKTIGSSYIAVPFLDEATRPGSAGFAAAVAAIAEFGALCAQAGIKLLYHNHDFEFIKLSGQFGLDFLYDAIPAKYLATELDTCWIHVAGQSPVAYIQKYAGRAPVIHLKDYIGQKTDGAALYALINTDGSDDKPVAVTAEAEFDFRPVGYGKQDIPAIIKAGVAAGADWFVVEQDRSSERPPLEAARMSCEYVRRVAP